MKAHCDREPAPWLTQPHKMKPDAYVDGVETQNGHDAWALFGAWLRQEDSPCRFLASSAAL